MTDATSYYVIPRPQHSPTCGVAANTADTYCSLRGGHPGPHYDRWRGIGWTPPKPCPDCGGAGGIWECARPSYCSHVWDKEWPCRTCDGTGEVPA